MLSTMRLADCFFFTTQSAKAEDITIHTYNTTTKTNLAGYKQGNTYAKIHYKT